MIITTYTTFTFTTVQNCVLHRITILLSLVVSPSTTTSVITATTTKNNNNNYNIHFYNCPELCVAWMHDPALVRWIRGHDQRRILHEAGLDRTDDPGFNGSDQVQQQLHQGLISQQLVQNCEYNVVFKKGKREREKEKKTGMKNERQKASRC